MSYTALYSKILPFFSLYSTLLGIDAGLYANKRMPTPNDITMFSNMIGYTSLGIITGLTYPISYPLIGSYILYKIK